MYWALVRPDAQVYAMALGVEFQLCFSD